MTTKFNYNKPVLLYYNLDTAMYYPRGCMLFHVLIYLCLSYFKKIVSNEKKEPNEFKNPMLEKSNEEQVIVLLILYLFNCIA